MLRFTVGKLFVCIESCMSSTLVWVLSKRLVRWKACGLSVLMRMPCKPHLGLVGWNFWGLSVLMRMTCKPLLGLVRWNFCGLGILMRMVYMPHSGLGRWIFCGLSVLIRMWYKPHPREVGWNVFGGLGLSSVWTSSRLTLPIRHNEPSLNLSLLPHFC